MTALTEPSLPDEPMSAPRARPTSRPPRRLDGMEVRSDDVQEILETTPTWLMRHGITSVVVAFLVIAASTWFIRYPEILEGKVTLTSKVPPIAVVARVDGRVERLFVVEGQRVEKGDVVAVIESSARAEDVFALIEELGAFEARLDDEGPRRTAGFRADWELGDMRSAFAALLQSVEDERLVFDGKLFEQRLTALRREISAYGPLDTTIAEEQRAVEEGVGLLSAQSARDDELAGRGGLSRVAQDEIKRRILEERIRALELRASTLRNGLSRAQAERGHLELEQMKRERVRGLDRAVREALRKLQSDVADWSYHYVLRAPTTGEVAFFDVWSADQRAKAGDEIMFVVPESYELLGRAVVTQTGVGRVRPGQRVRVRFDSYPSAQFGAVTATVVSLSSTARKDEFTVTLAFPERLETSFGRELAFKQGMRGTASIITDDVRLAIRLLGPLRYLVTTSLPETDRSEQPQERHQP